MDSLLEPCSLHRQFPQVHEFLHFLQVLAQVISISLNAPLPRNEYGVLGAHCPFPKRAMGRKLRALWGFGCESEPNRRAVWKQFWGHWLSMDRSDLPFEVRSSGLLGLGSWQAIVGSKTFLEPWMLRCIRIDRIDPLWIMIHSVQYCCKWMPSLIQDAALMRILPPIWEG